MFETLKERIAIKKKWEGVGVENQLKLMEKRKFKNLKGESKN